jgi:hypothetical protein
MSFAQLAQRDGLVRIIGVSIAASAQICTVAYLGSSVSGGDAYTYLQLSRDWQSWSSLLSPAAFDSNFWPAGYPGFLALFGWADSSQVVIVRIMQVLLAAAVALMSGRIADAVSVRAGTVTTVVVAFSPTALWAVWAIGYELLLAFLLMAGFILIWRDNIGRALWYPFIGGMLLGIALIVQFRAVVAISVLLVFVARSQRRKALVAGGGVALPILAWSARSWLAVGSPAPWSTNGPYNLWNGNNPLATGHNIFPIPPLPPGAASYGQAALDWIVANPGDFADVTARKFLYLFKPTQVAVVSDPFPGRTLVSIAEVALAGLIVTGLVLFLAIRLSHHRAGVRPLDAPFMFCVAYLLPNVFFIVEPRFSIPVHAMLISIAVCAWFSLMRIVRFSRPDLKSGVGQPSTPSSREISPEPAH